LISKHHPLNRAARAASSTIVALVLSLFHLSPRLGLTHHNTCAWTPGATASPPRAR
jgi:hypothetical protein